MSKHRMMRAGLVVTAVLCAGAGGCSGSRPGVESEVWLAFEEADSSSRFVLSVHPDGWYSATAEGALGSGRPLGQTSQGVLTESQSNELVALSTDALLSQYEKFSDGSLRTESASSPTFVVSFDARVPRSPVGKTTRFGFQGVVSDSMTHQLLSRLRETTLAAWTAGSKSGPNPGLVEPPSTY